MFLACSLAGEPPGECGRSPYPTFYSHPCGTMDSESISAFGLAFRTLTFFVNSVCALDDLPAKMTQPLHLGFQEPTNRRHTPPAAEVTDSVPRSVPRLSSSVYSRQSFWFRMRAALGWSGQEPIHVIARCHYPTGHAL